MEEMIVQLDKLIEKKTKISIENANAAVKLLYEIYHQNGDMKFLCEKMYSASYVVAGKFTKKYYRTFNETEQNAFVDNFIYIVNNAKSTQVILTVVFSIVSEIVNTQPQNLCFLKLLNKVIKFAGNNDGFTETKCKALKEHLLDKTNGDILNLDYSSWSKEDTQRFFRYIISSKLDINVVAYSSKIEKWMGTNGFSFINEPTDVISHSINLGVESSEQMSLNSNNTAAPRNFISSEEQKLTELFKNIATAQNEVQKLICNAFVKNNAFSALDEKVKTKDDEINFLKSKLEEKSKTIIVQNSQITTFEVAIVNKNKEIDDLTNRVKSSFVADDITKKQELITLKKDIASAIKLQYADFSENKDVACNEDNYEALKVSLNQIFRTLKRYGIEL